MQRLFVFFLVAVAVPCWAVPQLVNYQGYMTATDGTPLDSTVTVTFAIYDAESDGTVQWTETHFSVNVSDGLFHVLLGSVTTLPDLFNADRWLGIVVGDDAEMTPRQKVVSVAHAYRVGTVDGASGGTIAGSVIITDRLAVGTNHNTDGALSSVTGGSDNIASGANSHVGGGQNNRARGAHSVIGGGGSSVEADSNYTGNDYAVVGGGSANRASGYFSVIAGGARNIASGDRSTVGGGRGNRARGDYSVVAGGGGGTSADTNSASGAYSTISGGRSHRATAEEATISGGYVNAATALCATVSGGDHNTANGGGAAIGGGSANQAQGLLATVSGGFSNAASGAYASIAGGCLNEAGGGASFAAGNRAGALHDGAFVWGSTNAGGEGFTGSAGPYTYTARCPQGAYFLTCHSGVSSGVQLEAGGGSWSSLCDVRQKRLHGDVNTSEILQKISALPLHRWSYKSQDESIQHIGPTAQDFRAAFGLGESDTTINTLDPDGIALAAIQALHKEVIELRARVQTLEAAAQQGMKEEK